MVVLVLELCSIVVKPLVSQHPLELLRRYLSAAALVPDVVEPFLVLEVLEQQLLEGVRQAARIRLRHRLS